VQHRDVCWEFILTLGEARSVDPSNVFVSRHFSPKVIHASTPFFVLVPPQPFKFNVAIHPLEPFWEIMFMLVSRFLSSSTQAISGVTPHAGLEYRQPSQRSVFATITISFAEKDLMMVLTLNNRASGT
jgi:hypothetical protein